jgi:hypothetical protein
VSSKTSFASIMQNAYDKPNTTLKTKFWLKNGFSCSFLGRIENFLNVRPKHTFRTLYVLNVLYPKRTLSKKVADVLYRIIKHGQASNFDRSQINLLSSPQISDLITRINVTILPRKYPTVLIQWDACAPNLLQSGSTGRSRHSSRRARVALLAR